MVCFSEALNIFCLSDLPAIVVLNCTGGVIDITYANFGRSQPYDVVCSAPRGLSEIDACPNTGKYIQISYICTPGIYKDQGQISDQT